MQRQTQKTQLLSAILTGFSFQRHDIHGDVEGVAAGAENDAAHGAHISVVASPTERDVLHGGEDVVRRVHVDPADAGTEEGYPCV